MKILLTGATGFIGSALTKALLESGCDVIAIKRPTSDLSRLQDCKNLSLVFYDYENEVAQLALIFKEHKIDQVIHLATNYGREGDDPAVLQTNFLFPNQLLTLSLKNGVKRFISTDSFSSKIIGLNYLPAYHVTKRLFSQWANHIVEASNIEFINLYLQHPYGPFDNKNKFVPFIIDNLKSSKTELDLTAGLQKRDFIYIDDIISAYLCLVNADKIEEKQCDVGTGVSTSIRDFILLVKKLTENQITQLNFGILPTRENELMETDCDNSYLRSKGWVPKYTLENGLHRILEISKIKIKTS